ncbi:MAG: YceI family protein [Candidatus Dormibacteraceae bacterium]
MTKRYDLDPRHSRIGFVTKHMMVTNVRGQFARFAGHVEVDESDPGRLTAEVTVDTASIDTGVEDRDKHLRSGDFLESDTYPQMTFRATAARAAGQRRHRVTGDLTIKGTTRPIELDVEVEGDPFQDPWGFERVGISATGQLSRKDWGLTWNQVLEAGRLLVADSVKLEIEAALVRKVEETTIAS